MDKFVPTSDQRKQVETMAGLGLTAEQIGMLLEGPDKRSLGLSAAEVAEIFAEELRIGPVKSRAQIAQNSFKAAVANPKLGVEWLKVNAPTRQKAGVALLPAVPFPEDLTPKELAFCRTWTTNGHNALDAYRTSSDSKGNDETIHKASKRIAGKPKIAAYMAAVIAWDRANAERASEAVGLTKSKMMGDLANIFTRAAAKALEGGDDAVDPKAARLARDVGETIAKLNGWVVEKREVRQLRSITDIADDELEMIIREAEAAERSGQNKRH